MALRLVKTTDHFNKCIAAASDPIVIKGRIVRIGRRVARWYHFLGLEIIEGHSKNNPAAVIPKGEVYYFDPAYLEEYAIRGGRGRWDRNDE